MSLPKMKPIQGPKVRIVWSIKVTDESSAAGPGKFWMVDETGEMQWSPVEEQSRHKMAEYAFDHGADEVRHDYDLVKYRS